MSEMNKIQRPLHMVDAAAFHGLPPQRIPERARELAQSPGGLQDVCITRVLHADGRTMDWLQTEHACGWLVAQGAGAARSSAGFEAALRAAMVQGFVAADAAVLACWQPGQPLPLLSWGEAPPAQARPAQAPRPLGLYAIVDSAHRMQQVLAAGVRTVQLRMKTPPVPDAAWQAQLRREVQQCIAACAAAGAELFVNDHWQVAHALGAKGIHLGQSDLLALGDTGRAEVLATGMALGVSSHALWERCRARTLAPRYIACGPVWPTTTKDMPWLPQGLHNLGWWCSVAGAPVTAIGGILQVDQVRQAAASGADGVCIVRGLGDDPRATVPAFEAALVAGRATRVPAPELPHPTLPLSLVRARS
jgi:thiamine-phosphate diphosphorylase